MSIRLIAEVLGVSRETVRRDLRWRDAELAKIRKRFQNGEIVPQGEIEAVTGGPISDYDAIVAQWVDWHKCAKNGVSTAISDTNGSSTNRA